VTDRQTDHTTPSLTMGGIYVRSTAMWPNDNNINNDSSNHICTAPYAMLQRLNTCRQDAQV